jgi:hypothetical protein
MPRALQTGRFPAIRMDAESRSYHPGAASLQGANHPPGRGLFDLPGGGWYGSIAPRSPSTASGLPGFGMRILRFCAEECAGGPVDLHLRAPPGGPAAEKILGRAGESGKGRPVLRKHRL